MRPGCSPGVEQRVAGRRAGQGRLRARSGPVPGHTSSADDADLLAPHSLEILMICQSVISTATSTMGGCETRQTAPKSTISARKEAQLGCSSTWAPWRRIQSCPSSRVPRPVSLVPGGRAGFGHGGGGGRALDKPVSLTCQISHPRTSRGHLLLPSLCLGAVPSWGVHPVNLHFNSHALIQTRMRRRYKRHIRSVMS